MTGYVILAAVCVLVFTFVLQPLVRARRHTVTVTPAVLADLQARRQYLVEAIRDVDFDFETGKVGESEYQEIRGRYLHEAAEVLRDLERETGTFDVEVDREIAQLRSLARTRARPADGSSATS